MARCSSCGADLGSRETDAALCPGCLLRLALDRAPSGAAPWHTHALPKLLAPIGRGPVGITYVGQRRNEYPSYVTVKLIDAALDGERFCRVLHETIERLRSKPVARVAALLGAGIADDLRAFVLAEYVRGSEFTTFFQSSRTDARQRLRVLQVLVATVSSLHERGIVHGSLKPSNVVVCAGDDGPAPVLLDVGVRPGLLSARLPTTPTTESVQEESLQDRGAADIRALRTLVLRALDATPTSGARRLRQRLDRSGAVYDSASDLARELAGVVT